MKVLVVEDDADIQFLVRSIFSLDPRFSIGREVESAEEAIELARSADLGLIVLDQGLAGEMTGIDSAPLFKEVAPRAKIILFSAYNDIRDRAGEEPAIDAFLVKTDIGQLLSLAQTLTGLSPSPVGVRQR